MKTLYILFIALLVSGGVMAQSCLPDGIWFQTQTQIDSFQINYPNCTEIEGSVTIGGYDITNLDSLFTITGIGGSLKIGNYFMRPDDGWELIANPNLVNIQGLQNLISIGGLLQIVGNNALTELTGLDNLKTIDGSLVIGAIIYSGWGGVTFFGNAIEDLTALSNIESLGGGISITVNNISTLEGLNHIDPNTITYLNIQLNGNLTHCEIQSICDFLTAPNGTVSIHDNAAGCDSQQEVEAACESASIDEKGLKNSLTIYPNPSSTQITIELPTTPQKNTILTIYNLNGQQFLSQHITEPQTLVDISGLTSGVYFVKVVDDEKVMMGKVVKQ
jgi:hypothetical protein